MRELSLCPLGGAVARDMMERSPIKWASFFYNYFLSPPAIFDNIALYS